MTWDWSSPVAIGLFVLLCGGAIMLASIGFAVITGAAKVSDIFGRR